MCTLIISSSKDRILVGTNRDENPNRPSETWKHRNNGIFCPLDLKRGGTWIGVNNKGMLCALTNLDTDNNYKVNSSRGEMVLDLLSKDFDKADSSIFHLSKKYRPFNLVLLNKDKGYSYTNYGKRLMSNYIDSMHVPIVVTAKGVFRDPTVEKKTKKYNAFIYK